MPAALVALVCFYHWVDGVGVAELSRLARTVKAWEAEILAWHATGGCSNGPTEALNLLIKGQAGRARLPRLRQLPSPAAVALRRPVADAPNRKPCQAAPHTWGRRACNDNAPSADRILCRGRAASGSRRHEGSSGMVVSRRSRALRPPRRAARLQARMGSGSASPPRAEPTVLASPRSLSQFGLVRLVAAGRRADAARLGGLREGPLGPTSAGPLAAAAEGWVGVPGRGGL
jgi:hypothetical protein